MAGLRDCLRWEGESRTDANGLRSNEMPRDLLGPANARQTMWRTGDLGSYEGRCAADATVPSYHT